MDSKSSDVKSMGAHNGHSKSYEIIEHRARRSIKLGKQGGWKAHNLIFIALIYYTGMIIDNCKTFAERLGNQATYKN